MVEVGDILLALYGANSGDIAISKIHGAINQAILCIRTNMVSVFFKSVWEKHTQKILDTYLQGGQGNLSAEIVKKIFIHLPAYDEQLKLAAFISKLEERIAIQNKVIEKYESLIKAINDSVISRLLKGRVVSFKDLYVEAGEGGTPSTSEHSYYKNGSIPFIKIDDLSDKYLTINKDFITELGVQKSSAWVVPENSIIYSNGATIGAISISTYPVCTKQGILGIVPTSDVRTEYLYYFMSSSYFNKQVQRIVTEGTMKTAYLKDINLIKCPLPTIDEQDKIAYGLSSISSKLELEKQLRNKLLSTKKYLLQVLFI